MSSIIGEKKLPTDAEPGAVHAAQMVAGAPDLATCVHLLTRAVCDALGPNTCPFKGALKDGQCPANWEPCKVAKVHAPPLVELVQSNPTEAAAMVARHQAVLPAP